jgi:hypothetical protein
LTGRHGDAQTCHETVLGRTTVSLTVPFVGGSSSWIRGETSDSLHLTVLFALGAEREARQSSALAAVSTLGVFGPRGLGASSASNATQGSLRGAQHEQSPPMPAGPSSCRSARPDYEPREDTGRVRRSFSSRSAASALKFRFLFQQLPPRLGAGRHDLIIVGIPGSCSRVSRHIRREATAGDSSNGITVDCDNRRSFPFPPVVTISNENRRTEPRHQAMLGPGPLPRPPHRLFSRGRRSLALRRSFVPSVSLPPNQPA